MKAWLRTALRVLRTLRPPSRRANIKRMQRRGESLDTITIREARATDIPALGALHAKTWSNTYPRVVHPPTAQLREYQWKEQFKVTDGSWCCFVVENSAGQLVGFAKGTPFKAAAQPDFNGELSKIYLLREYQRLGLGSRLLEKVVQHFLQRNIHNILLFADPGNASCRFYETLGAEKLFDKNGAFHGTYGWRNLQELLNRLCQAAPRSTRSSTRAGS
ncbi:GNAT family N-acetyltransferase [Chitinophaga alhagiae]|uniref:GNAT family N-acetyltransferase n=1 Tax=Chitinophaga alhagiae TaxID=2203219 RepID=UPI001300735A|nr:GNAT family N-acetyltransferase [Chitinophaga alhagiae]